VGSTASKRLARFRRSLPILLTLTLSGCGGCASSDDLAFCDAVARKDAAAATALLKSGRVNLLSRNFSGKCQPAMVALDAEPQSIEMTALAVLVAKQEGVANASFTTSSGSSSASGSSRRRDHGGRGGALRAIQFPIQNGNVAVVRALIEAGADVRSTGARNEFPTAVGGDYLEIVRLMVEAGADPNWGLRFAIDSNHPAIVTYLESKGAREDVDPLLIDARRGDLASVEAAIARRANLEVTDPSGRTPLMRAAYYRHAAVVTRLAKAGASVRHVVEGHTALHLAANQNDAPVIRALAAAGADVNARPGGGAPPLRAAIENSAAAAVAALVDLGADTNFIVEGDRPPVARAIQLGNLAMVRALLRGGARINDQRGPGAEPPIHIPLGFCGPPPEGPGENDVYRVNLLRAIVEAGASATAKNAAGQTPIDVVTKDLATQTHPFYKACAQAKLDYLRSVQAPL
jgi:ankyrin repeat protein